MPHDTDTAEELGLILDKLKTAVEYVIEDDAISPRAQTMAYIASDYIAELGKAIQESHPPL